MSLSNSSCASSVRLSAQSAVMGVIACGTRKSQSITVHMGWKVTRTAQKAMTDVRLPLGLEMRIKIRAMLNDCVLLMNENNTNLSRSFSCTVIWFAGPAVLPSVTWSHTECVSSYNHQTCIWWWFEATCGHFPEPAWAQPVLCSLERWPSWLHYCEELHFHKLYSQKNTMKNITWSS